MIGHAAPHRLGGSVGGRVSRGKARATGPAYRYGALAGDHFLRVVHHIEWWLRFVCLI